MVLVADPTLSADYSVLFEGIFATMQTSEVPSWLMRRLMCRPAARDARGRARVAPLGLRRMEACLLARTGLRPEDIAVATPQWVDSLLGPWTRLVAVSSSDPLGRGMSNSTTVHFCRGELYTQLWTDRLMRRIRRSKDEHGFRVVAGGGGAWQYAQDAEATERHGVDTVFEGYFERQGPDLFQRLGAGGPAPPHVREDGAALPVEPIRGPSTMGMVELSRGCGKGCRFCIAGRTAMEHVPIDTILADVERNVAAGLSCAVSSSEDFFRYGGRGPHVDYDALHGLLVRLGEIEGLRLLQIDHGNVSSIAQLDVPQLRELRRLLARGGASEYPWINIGVESANGALVAANGPGKVAPFRPDAWEGLVRDVAARLHEAGFFPVFSIVLGLPGEAPDDVARTRRLVEELKRRPAAVFPVFHQPVQPDAGDALTPANLRPDQLELFTACYEANFRWVPRLYWDNQRAAGVRWTRRALLQLLGRGEVRLWRRRFRRMRRRIRPGSGAGAAVLDSAAGQVEGA